MRNTMKLFGIIALVAMIGFGMVACGPEGDDNGNGGGGVTIPSDLRGTWVEGEYKDGTVTAKSSPQNGDNKYIITANAVERKSYKDGEWVDDPIDGSLNEVSKISSDNTFNGGSYQIYFWKQPNGPGRELNIHLSADKNAFKIGQSYYRKQQ